MIRLPRAALTIATLALLAWPADRATTQTQRPAATTTNVPNAVQGFSRNRNQPINIEASTLEVHDKTKLATFRGKVHVKQGDTELRCNALVVHYEEDRGGGTSGSQSALPASEGQRIRLLEANGNVVVTQKDQIATGDAGVFDMRKNLITLRGNVVVSQGRNVVRGDRLIVDMTTAVSRIESDRGRVQGLFQPSTQGEPDRGGSLMPKLR
jgi:lipopolysaccharide export system protein LptA